MAPDTPLLPSPSSLALARPRVPSPTMRDILNDLHRWQAAGEEIALATLIDTHGASPRPAGARLCCTRTGHMVGSVSGGCVETDVFERAMQVLADERPVIQSYGIDDEMSVAVGLSCGGEIDVLIEPWRDDDVWQALTRVVERRERAALCVALSPDDMLGRHLLVVEGSGRLGGIDDAIDGELEATAATVLAHGEARIVTLERGGQEHRVYIESFAPEPRLFIVGATHTAIPLCNMAAELGFHVTVVDPRTPFATRDRFPRAAELLLEWPDQVLAEASLDRESYVVSLTHDLKFDIPTLAAGAAHRKFRLHRGPRQSSHPRASQATAASQRASTRRISSAHPHTDRPRPRGAQPRARLPSRFWPRWSPFGTTATDAPWSNASHRFTTPMSKLSIQTDPVPQRESERKAEAGECAPVLLRRDPGRGHLEPYSASTEAAPHVGRTKALLAARRRQRACASSARSEVIVVLGHDSETIRTSLDQGQDAAMQRCAVRVVVNPRLSTKGQSSSLQGRPGRRSAPSAEAAAMYCSAISLASSAEL